MAAEILLEINGHKYNASGFSYDFYQVPDFKGKSVTGIKGGDIHVVLDSSYDNSILETMLSDKTRKVPCVPWEEYEPCPVSGRIQFVQDDVHVFRELAFEEAYITRYKEKMDANGYPMSILLTISTLRLDINKFVRMDRRPETTYGFGWVRFKEKEVEKSPMSKSYAEPMVLVTSVKGKETALPNEKVKYEVTGYNISNVKDKDRKRVKWDIVVEGKQEKQKEQGEVLHLQIKEEWVGKEITVMPYLKQATTKTSVKTEVLYEPQVRLIITNQVTGYTIQRLKGDSDMFSKNVVIIPTYRVDVFNYEKCEKKLEFSFNVTRDAWYNLGVENGKHKILNRAFIPADWSKNLYGAMWIPSYPRFSGMGAFILTRYGERKLPAKPLLTQKTLEGKSIDSPRNDENFASDVMIHVSGVYEIFGIDYLGGSYGCFGFIPDDDIYGTIEKAKKALEKNLYAQVTSNEEWKKVTNRIQELPFPQKKKIQILLEEYKPKFIY